MKSITKFSLVLFCFFLIFHFGCDRSGNNQGSPIREDGISVYLTPENVVENAGNKEIQRFTVKSSNIKAVVASSKTALELVKQFEEQSPEVKANGIWLILTHPDSYGKDDTNEYEKLKSLAKERGISFFVTRASELPDGWKRVN